MSTQKPIVFNEKDRAVVAALAARPEGLTLAELREVTGMELVAGNVSSMMKKQLIAPIGERTVEKEFESTVSTYTVITLEPTKTEKGTDNTYTDKQVEVLKACAAITSPFTLADLAVAMGVEKVAPGIITGLVKKGNLAKGEPRPVTRTRVSEVNIYGLVDGAVERIAAATTPAKQSKNFLTKPLNFSIIYM